MPLSIIDIYRDLLPKTNCGECGFPTCLAFAGMVVSEKIPLSRCPYIEPSAREAAQAELDRQYAAGKWTRRDPGKDALEWARERAASMRIQDLPGRIGGALTEEGEARVLDLPYFNTTVRIAEDGIRLADGSPLNRWEQVFLYNHMAQGGDALPTGNWKGLEQIPNTVSKIKSMKAHVEEPIRKRFEGAVSELRAAATAIGGEDARNSAPAADATFLFRALPRIPVLLLFWDRDDAEGFESRVKVLFDETIPQHLDIESILFLSERLVQLLCKEP